MKDDIKVTSKDIKIALSNTHALDFFATEVKNGATYFPNADGLLIFDGLAIKKSWTKPCITIYEIKVSRSDFLRDGKFQCYYPYCNEFYFVVPAGMVKKTEVPDPAGLKYYNPETGAIRTVKKAIWRTCVPNENMMMYIIMNKLDNDRIPFYSKKKDYIRAYIEDRMDSKQLASLFSSKLIKENRDLHRKIENMQKAEQLQSFHDGILAVLEKHGIPTYWEASIPKRLDEALLRGCPKNVEIIERALQDALSALNGIKKTALQEKNRLDNKNDI